MSDVSPGWQAELDALRHEIDAIDQQVVDLLSKRQHQVEKVLSLKKAYNLQVYHPAREEDLISARREQATYRGTVPGLY